MQKFLLKTVSNDSVNGLLSDNSVVDTEDVDRFFFFVEAFKKLETGLATRTSGVAPQRSPHTLLSRSVVDRFKSLSASGYTLPLPVACSDTFLRAFEVSAAAGLNERGSGGGEGTAMWVMPGCRPDVRLVLEEQASPCSSLFLSLSHSYTSLPAQHLNASTRLPPMPASLGRSHALLHCVSDSDPLVQARTSLKGQTQGANGKSVSDGAIAAVATSTGMPAAGALPNSIIIIIIVDAKLSVTACSTQWRQWRREWGCRPASIIAATWAKQAQGSAWGREQQGCSRGAD